jgi:hypothetical protein
MVTKAVEKEIVALVQDKKNDTIQSGKNQGQIYLSYLLADPETGEETWYKQFNQVGSGEPVQPGEVWRFKVSEKPANNGTVFHNVEKVLGQAGATDEVTDTPTPNGMSTGAGAVGAGGLDMPGVYNRERSIERQVSVKSAVDLVAIRASLIQLVWQTMPGEIPTDGEVDPRFALADDMWVWIVKNKPTDLAAAFANYLQS